MRKLLGTVVVLLLIGCLWKTDSAVAAISLNSDSAVAQIEVDAKQVHPADKTAEQAADKPAAPDVPDSLISEPANAPLTLATARALALARNPRLAVFSQQRRVAEAHALQSSLRPNPQIALEIENFAGSGIFKGFDVAEITLSLAQVFELGGKRSNRHQLADLEAELAGWDYEAQRLEVLTQVTREFVAVLAVQQQVSLAAELVQVAEQDLAAVTRRVEAGATSPIEATRARIALATARLDENQLRHRLSAARIRLAALWDSQQPVFSEAVGQLEKVASPPKLAQLQQRQGANPDNARWETEMKQRREAVAVAEAEGKLDLEVAAGIRQHGFFDDYAFVAALALPLPLNNRNQGEVLAAEENLIEAEHARRAVIGSAHARLAVAHRDLVMAYGEVTTLQRELLPETQSAMATAEEAYLKGMFSFTDVLAVRKTSYDLRGRYFTALASYHTAVVNIERLIGTSLLDWDQPQE